MHSPFSPPRFTFASLLLLAVVLPVTPAGGTPAGRPTLASQVFHFEQFPVATTPQGERRDIADHRTPTLERLECQLLTLAPGQSWSASLQPMPEELILVKEGRMEVRLAGQSQTFGPGSVIFRDARDAGELRNAGNERVTCWTIRFTTPTTHHPGKHHQAPTLKSSGFDWSTLPVVKRPTGESRQILRGSTCTMDSLSCHATTVNGGLAAHGAHRHPDDEIVVVKEGLLEATIEGVAQRPAGPGSLFFFASNELHGMRNAGDTRVTYYVIRMITAATPRPPPAAKKQG